MRDRFIAPARWVGPWRAKSDAGEYGWSPGSPPWVDEQARALVQWVSELLAVQEEVTLTVRRTPPPPFGGEP